MFKLFFTVTTCHVTLFGCRLGGDIQHLFSGVPSADIVKSIRLAAHAYGQIMVFKVYADVVYIKSSAHLDPQLAGVSLVDCPHNGKNEVADRMITVDIMVNAMDNFAPGTVILITGDQDFTYVISILRMRCYCVIVIAPSI
jgi:NYN domain